MFVTVMSSTPAPTEPLAPSVSNFTFTCVPLYELRSNGATAASVAPGNRVPKLVHDDPSLVEIETVMVLLASLLPP